MMQTHTPDSEVLRPTQLERGRPCGHSDPLLSECCPTAACCNCAWPVRGHKACADAHALWHARA
eukprot:2125-Alexandrium_andersonii.AAC.1